MEQPHLRLSLTASERPFTSRPQPGPRWIAAVAGGLLLHATLLIALTNLHGRRDLPSAAPEPTLSMVFAPPAPPSEGPAEQASPPANEVEPSAPAEPPRDAEQPAQLVEQPPPQPPAQPIEQPEPASPSKAEAPASTEPPPAKAEQPVEHPEQAPPPLQTNEQAEPAVPPPKAEAPAPAKPTEAPHAATRPPPRQQQKPRPVTRTATAREAVHPQAEATPARGGTSAPASEPSTATPAAAPSAADLSSWRQALAAWLAKHKTYPEDARRRGMEGTVTVRFTVDPSGRVTDVAVVRTSASSVLDDAAEAMLRNATLPPSPEGQASITVRIHYALND